MKAKFKTQAKGGKREGIHQRVKGGKEIHHRYGIYLVWWEYVEYLFQRGGIKEGIYDDWELKKYIKSNKSNFDKFWKNKVDGLFNEPSRGNVQKITSIPKVIPRDRIYLEVPINTQPIILESKCKEIIDAEFKRRKLNPKSVFPSDAKYQMEISDKFNTLVWRRRLMAVKWQEEGLNREAVYDKLQKQKQSGANLYGGTDNKLDKQRVVSRDIQLARKLLKNVAQGKFNINFMKPKRK